MKHRREEDRPLNIGINMLAFLPNISGGIEFYILNLLSALADIDTHNNYYIFLNLDNYDIVRIPQANFHCIKVNFRARPQIRRILVEQLLLPGHAKRYHLDVLHSPSYTFPLLSNVPGIVTICDMLYKSYPWAIPWSKRAFWKLAVPFSAKRCREVLTISEFSKNDIIRILRLRGSKVTVTPLAVDRRFAALKQGADQNVGRVLSRYQISSPYILSVGGVGFQKNPLALLKLLKQLRMRPATKELSLVITGNDYGLKKRLEKEISNLNLVGSVLLLGYVDRADLPALYAGSQAFVSTSLFEGFGLTILESMACGTPVVISNRASLPEVAGNAALIVDPDKIDELEHAVTEMFTNRELREIMISRGLKRAAEFTWTQTAELTLNVYERAAEAGRNAHDQK